jgi:hypothetical protein
MKTRQTQLQKQRAAWLAKHPFTLGMPVEKALQYCDELIRRFPLTPEERRERSTHVDVEFVL